LATVYFSPLSSKLSKAAKKKLEAAVIANPSAVYKITGYVQKSIFAKNAKNDASLSLARAKAIETHLASLGAGVTFTVVTDAGKVPVKNGKSNKARRATLYAMTPVVQ
jgi:predicted esterase